MCQNFAEQFLFSGRQGADRVPETMRVPDSFAHFANESALDCRKTLDRTTPDFQRPFLQLHPHRSCLSITRDVWGTLIVSGIRQREAA